MSTAAPAFAPADGRSEAERLERSWGELLQELRALQTGTQLLTGFLLLGEFLPEFRGLPQLVKNVYAAIVLLAAVSQVLALAPIPLHRGLFRLRARTTLLRLADRCLRLSLVGTGLVLTGVAFLVVAQAAGVIAGVVAGVCGFLFGVALWLVLPLQTRRGRERA